MFPSKYNIYTAISSQGTGIVMEEGVRMSIRVRGSQLQSFPETTGQLQMWPLSDCDTMHKSYTSSRQARYSANGVDRGGDHRGTVGHPKRVTFP